SRPPTAPSPSTATLRSQDPVTRGRGGEKSSDQIPRKGRWRKCQHHSNRKRYQCLLNHHHRPHYPYIMEEQSSNHTCDPNHAITERLHHRTPYHTTLTRTYRSRINSSDLSRDGNNPWQVLGMTPASRNRKRANCCTERSSNQPWNSSSFLQRDHSHAHSSRGEAQPQRLHPPGAFQTQQPLPPPHPSHTAAASGGPVRPVSTPGHAEWQHVDPSWLKPDPASSPPSTAASSLFPSLSLLPPPYHQANHPRAGAGTPGERGAGDKADTYSFGEESFQDFQSPDAPFEAFSFPGNAKGGGDDETKGPNASTAEWSSRSKKLTEATTQAQELRLSNLEKALDQKLSQVPAWDERITKEKLEQLGGVVMVDSSPVLSSAVRNDAIHKYAPKDFHIKQKRPSQF
ncbi:hypothetical protein NGA_0645600, partial [Nannochloropsis gaditana CCMP526]|uniref:uncharacterized protein n=1 Tax=Nannochloropsis gaditana (strain CCMP526) TaxID=1093141 RepID=UPI00029F53FE